LFDPGHKLIGIDDDKRNRLTCRPAICSRNCKNSAIVEQVLPKFGVPRVFIGFNRHLQVARSSETGLDIWISIPSSSVDLGCGLSATVGEFESHIAEDICEVCLGLFFQVSDTAVDGMSVGGGETEEALYKWLGK
jgi:hypothetical protein